MVEKVEEPINKLEELLKTMEEQTRTSANSSSRELTKILNEMIKLIIKPILENIKEFEGIVNTFSREINFETACSQEALKMIQNRINEANDRLEKASKYAVNEKIKEFLNTWKSPLEQILNSVLDPTVILTLTQLISQMETMIETYPLLLKSNFLASYILLLAYFIH
jgi:16S rRNA C1402 (ribose-2'-O) methylase RsmI